MGFSRQEYWSGLSFPPPGNLPDPGIKPASRTCPVLAGRFFITSATWESPVTACKHANTLDSDIFPHCGERLYKKKLTGSPAL